MPVIERITTGGDPYLTKATIYTFVPSGSTGNVQVAIIEDSYHIDFQGKEWARLRIVTNSFPVVGKQVSGIEIGFVTSADTVGKTGITKDLALRDRVSQSLSYFYSSGGTGTSAVTFIQVPMTEKPFDAAFQIRFFAGGDLIRAEDGSIYEITTGKSLTGSGAEFPLGYFNFDDVSVPGPGTGSPAPETRAESRFDGISTQWGWTTTGTSEPPAMLDVYRAFESQPTAASGWTFVGTAVFTRVEGFKEWTGGVFCQLFDSAVQSTSGTFYYFGNPVHRDGWKRDLDTKAIPEFVTGSVISATVKPSGIGGTSLAFTGTHYLDGTHTVNETFEIVDDTLYILSGATTGGGGSGFTWDHWHRETFTGVTSGVTSFTVSQDFDTDYIWVKLSGNQLLENGDYTVSAPRTINFINDVRAYTDQIVTIEYIDTS